jgi:hypothetical protein
VFVFPDYNLGYYWSFWNDVMAPTLETLNLTPPPYLGGWDNPASEAVVDAALRAALEANPYWNVKVDYSVEST